MKFTAQLILALLVAVAIAFAIPFSVPSSMLRFAAERAMTLWMAFSSGLAILAACAGMGLLCIPSRLLRRDLLLALLFAFGSGAGLLSCAVLVPGMLPGSAVTREAGWILILVSIASGMARIYPLFRERVRDTALKPEPHDLPRSFFEAPVIILLTWGFGLLAVTTFAPALLFDVTEYHLGAWRDNAFGLKAGGHALKFDAIPHNFYARFPFPIESLYWLGLVLSEPLDFAPKVINAAFVIACALLVMRILRGVVKSRVLALVGALLVLVQPVMREVSLDAFIDAPVAFLVLAAVVAACTLPVVELPIAFLLFGVGLASKYTVAQIYLLPFLLLVLILRWRDWRVSNHKLITAALALFAIALPSIFWLGKNVLLYGNPLEPFFCSLFRSTDTAGIAREKFYVASHYPQSFWTAGYWTSLLPRTRNLGWILLPLACVTPLLLRGDVARENAAALRRQSIGLLVFVLVSYLLWNLVRESQSRFLLPDIFIVSYLAILALDHLPHRYLRCGITAVLLGYSAVHLLHQTFTLANAGEFRYLAEFELTRPQDSNLPDPRKDFYQRNLGALGEILPAANQLPRGSSILLVYEARPYLFTTTVKYNTVWDASELLRIAGDATSATEVARRLRQAGITHVLVNRQELRRYIQQYATAEQLRALGVGPREDAAAAFYATPTPEDLFPPFYRSEQWAPSRAAVIEFLVQSRGRAVAAAGTTPTEIYLAPVP